MARRIAEISQLHGVRGGGQLGPLRLVEFQATLDLDHQVDFSRPIPPEEKPAGASAARERSHVALEIGRDVRAVGGDRIDLRIGIQVRKAPAQEAVSTLGVPQAGIVQSTDGFHTESFGDPGAIPIGSTRR